jgi:hypothetical protein
MNNGLNSTKMVIRGGKPAYQIYVPDYGHILLFGSLSEIEIESMEDFEVSGIRVALTAYVEIDDSGHVLKLDVVEKEDISWRHDSTKERSDYPKNHWNRSSAFLQAIGNAIEGWTSSSVGFSILSALTITEDLRAISSQEYELADVNLAIMDLMDKIERLKERRQDLKASIKNLRTQITPNTENLNRSMAEYEKPDIGFNNI